MMLLPLGNHASGFWLAAHFMLATQRAMQIEYDMLAVDSECTGAV